MNYYALHGWIKVANSALYYGILQHSNICMYVIMDIQYILPWKTNIPVQAIFEHEEYKILLTAYTSVPMFHECLDHQELLTVCHSASTCTQQQ